MWPNLDDLEQVSDHQRQVLAQALCSRLGILTGGPGTGKTFTLAALLKLIAKREGGETIAVCAPTGKAANRVTVAMIEAEVPVDEATTVHRLLGVNRNGHDGGGWGFRYNEGNPLPFSTVALSEASMLGTDLAADFFAAIGPRCKVLLEGDDGQLSPVPHGSPLRDLLASPAVPHGELTEIHRNFGGIVAACRAIREGRPWQPSPRIDVAAGHNLLHIESMLPNHTRGHLERLLGTLPAGLSPLWDVQVMTALRKSKVENELASSRLNRTLQAMLNGQGQQAAGCPLRIGDKVICTRNQLLPLADQDATRVFVANGDAGQVLHVEAKLAVVRFDWPERIVACKGEVLETIDLAYALTVHKMQGSQAQVAIYISDDAPGARFVASKQLIYTALSRAERLAVTLGKMRTMLLDCRRDSVGDRKTFLQERIAAAA